MIYVLTFGNYLYRFYGEGLELLRYVMFSKPLFLPTHTFWFCAPPCIRLIGSCGSRGLEGGSDRLIKCKIISQRGLLMSYFVGLFLGHLCSVSGYLHLSNLVVFNYSCFLILVTFSQHIWLRHSHVTANTS